MTYTVTAPSGETIRGLDAYQVLSEVARLLLSLTIRAETLRHAREHEIHRFAADIVCRGGVAGIAVTVD